MENTRLCNIQENTIYIVKKIDTASEMAKRLSELGLICGTEVKCLFRAPSGDPTAYLIRGASIALRRECTENIIVSR